MPRRTVQEVTVQDVQKRRIPSKHYVRYVLDYNSNTERGYSAVQGQVITKSVRLQSEPKEEKNT